MQSPFASYACQKPLTTNSTLGRSNNNNNSSYSGPAPHAANKGINNVVRVAPRPKNPSQSSANLLLNNTTRQNQFANSGGGAYRTNVFATDYFQQQTTNRTSASDTRTNGNGMNTLGSQAINFTAYQQPNYTQYAHTAPRNRSAGGAGPSPRNANVVDGQGDAINGTDQCKSLLPNPFLISRAAAAVTAAQSKGKLPGSASTGTGTAAVQAQGGGEEGGDGTNKKFNSLKSSLAGLRKTPQFYYSMRSGAAKEGQSKSGKSCKRHQSFNQPQDVLRYTEEEAGQQQQYYEGGEQQHSLYYEEQPLYENLTDSIQIHELSGSSVQQKTNVDQQQAGLVINDQQTQKPKHHQKPLHKIHQHRHHHHGSTGEKLKKAHHKSCDMIERNSIYRSDSGISNSSYECITPVPAPRTANGEPVVVEAGTSGGTSTGRKSKKKMPVYMNLASHLGTTREAAGTDCVDGMGTRPTAAAANAHQNANTKHAEVCVPNINTLFHY